MVTAYIFYFLYNLQFFYTSLCKNNYSWLDFFYYCQQANMAILFSILSLDFFTTAIATFIFLYYFSVKTFSYWKNLGVKYVKPVPFFGNSLPMTFRTKSDPITLQEIYNKFPEERYVGMFIFRTPFLVLRDPHLIHSILTKDFSNFYDRGVSVDERLDLLSLHLVNLRGQQWKSLRSKLTPSFSSGKLKGMANQLHACAEVLSEYLQNCIEKNCNNSVDVREIMAKFATDVIGTCAFGLQFNTLKDPRSEFRKMGQEIFKPSVRALLKSLARTVHPSLPYYLNLKVLRPDVETFYLDFVKNAVEQREKNQIERKDFIQLLIEVRKNELAQTNKESNEKSCLLTDQVLASNAFVFFLAGFETTSSTMSFLLLELAVNSTIQDRVREEIVQVLNNHHNELSYEAVTDIPYLEMVISETLRKYPIGSVLVRECTQSYQVPESNLVLKKDTKVLIPTFAIHRDPRFYPNPEHFDPERFSSENKKSIIPGTYLPFGDGPRICIGLRFAMLEMKFALCKILPKYRFSLNRHMTYPVQFKAGGPLLAPENGILLDVTAV